MEVKDRLIKELLTLPDAKVQSGHSEVVIHCPFCKDRHVTPKFYIGVSDENIIPYKCFHGDCGLGGILTPDILHRLGIVNADYDSYLNSINRKGISKVKNTINLSKELIIPTEYKEEDMNKIEYASNRTGVDFTDPKNIKEYKMIYDINKFCQLNGLDLGLGPLVFKDLTNHWVGFLGYSNNIINMRNVDSRINENRYSNIKIDKTSNNSFLYVPPQEIDLLTPSPKIVIAEGAYDIICVKNRFFPNDSTNIIFGAVGTAASYYKGLMRLLKISCFFDAEITIFGDQDIPAEFYLKKFSKLMDNNTFKLIRNKKGKDFGNINEKYAFDIVNLNTLYQKNI